MEGWFEGGGEGGFGGRRVLRRARRRVGRRGGGVSGASKGRLSTILTSSLSDLLRREQGSYVSLDIGSSAIKVLEVDGAPSSPRILKAGIASLPPTAVQANLIQEPDVVAGTIISLLDDKRIRSKRVVTAVPGPAVIIKKVTLSGSPGADLDKQVMAEAANFIPESLDLVNLDYQIIDRPSATVVEVILVAVKKEIINSYTSVIRQTGLEPVVVDVDYFALENMYQLNYEPRDSEIVALVNIGARYSSINILKGGRSSFTGDVAVGGAEFNDLLMRNLGLSFEEAEHIKRGGKTDRFTPEQIETFVGPATQFLIDEIQRALSFFWRTASEEPLGMVYLSGGTAMIPGIVRGLAQRLEIPVELVDPTRHLIFGRGADAEFVKNNASSLAVSVGLATRRPGDK